MKIQTLLLALAVTAGAALSSAAFAQTATPKLDQREANQQNRINQGVATGQLTQREANNLQRRENKLNANEARAKADGVVTPAERRRLQREANHNSRKIYHKKHNRRTAPR
jgi:opacity protein-like surface antigen